MHRRANYFRGYKISRILRNFTLNKNFHGKNFEGMDNPQNFLVHVASMWRLDM